MEGKSITNVNMVNPRKVRIIRAQGLIKDKMRTVNLNIMTYNHANSLADIRNDIREKYFPGSDVVRLTYEEEC